MKRLLRIGDMARLTGVSIKALRFYDEQGLLRPDHVDPQTGYRHYTPDQAQTLAMITNLRAIDFSIAEITALIGNGPAETASLLRAIEMKQGALEAERASMADKIKTANILSAMIDQEKATAFRLTTLPEQQVCAVRKRVPHLGEPVTEIFEAAEAAVAANNARADRAPFLIFHDPPTVKIDLEIEVCIPVETAADDMTTIAGAPLAVATVYAGGYETTEKLFSEMSSRIANAGLSAAGPLREVYHRFGADQEDYSLPAKMLARHRVEFLTELQIPISSRHQEGR